MYHKLKTIYLVPDKYIHLNTNILKVRLNIKKKIVVYTGKVLKTYKIIL